MAKKKEDLYAIQYVLTEFATCPTAAQKKFDEMMLAGEVGNGELVKVATRAEVESAVEVLLLLRETLHDGKPMERQFEEDMLKEHFDGRKADFGPWLSCVYDAANRMTQAS